LVARVRGGDPAVVQDLVVLLTRGSKRTKWVIPEALLHLA
jgi:hypothetical protein